MLVRVAPLCRARRADNRFDGRHCVLKVPLHIGSVPMAFRPNYRFERAERNRLKQAKKDEKSKRQQERASLRRENGSVEAARDGDLPEEEGATSKG